MLRIFEKKRQGACCEYLRVRFDGTKSWLIAFLLPKYSQHDPFFRF